MNEQTYTLALGEQLSRHLRNMGELLDVIAKMSERIADLEREVAVLDARTRQRLEDAENVERMAKDYQ